MSSINGGTKLQSFLDKIKAQKARVDVGFFPEAKYVDGTQVAQVAIDNEFGVRENDKFIPPRPFLHPTYQEQKSKWLKILESEIKKQGDKVDVKKALTVVGFVAQKDVQEKIDWWAAQGVPRNAQETIDKKGFDSPLIETGHMRESVNYKVTSK